MGDTEGAEPVTTANGGPERESEPEPEPELGPETEAEAEPETEFGFTPDLGPLLRSVAAEWKEGRGSKGRGGVSIAKGGQEL